MEVSNNKISMAELTKEQLMEKIAILQAKLKEIIGKKNTLVSAISIEKIHSREFEELNARLMKENQYLKGLLGDKLPEVLPSFTTEKQYNETKNVEKSEISSESCEVLDFDLNNEEKLRNLNVLDSMICQINKESFLRKPDYDIRIKCNTVRDFENGSCVIKSKYSEQILTEKKQRKCMMLAAFGANKKGKTYILSKLCGFEIPVDSQEKCQSQGVNLKYPRDSTEFGFLDLYGSHLSFNELNLSDQVRQIEDRILIRSFMEEFMLECSDAIVIVVGEMTFEDEVLIERIKKLYYNKKKIFVIHNFAHLSDVETVEKRMTFDMKKEGKTKKNLKHVFFAKEWSPAAEKYNKKGIEMLRKALLVNQGLKEFDLVTKFKEFFRTNAERYQFPKGSVVEEKMFNEKKILQMQMTKNNAKVTALPRLDVFGNVVDRMTSPFYRINQVTNNFLKVYVDLPGTTNYKVSLLQNEEGENDALIFSLKTAIFKIGESQDGEKEMEDFEYSFRVPLNDSLIKHRSEILGNKLEDGVLEIDVELM